MKYTNNIFFCLLICFIFFVLLSAVVAGDNVTNSGYVTNDSRINVGFDTVTALEDGHFNTSFNDSSKGYCLEYMEEEARKGDVFYKVSSDYYSMSNSIKLYFVDYTTHALGDKVVCQHMIWHFTDGFNGWRLNYTIINAIKNSSKIIPDFYIQPLNSTHERVWNFYVALSPYEHHQDYFNYRFYDRLIDITDCTNESEDGVNVTVNNTMVNESIVNDGVDITKIDNESTKNNASEYTLKGSGLKKQITGNPIGLVIIIIVILVLIISDKKEKGE